MNEASALAVKVVVAEMREACSLRRLRHCMLKALSSASMTYSSAAISKQSSSCLQFAHYGDLKAA